MDVKTFDKTDELADFVYDEICNLQEKEALAKIEAKLKEVAANLPKGYSIALNFTLEIIDEHRERSLKTLQTGLCCEQGQDPQFSSVGASPAKYVVDGAMMKVPHDHCPNCWAFWGFKSRTKECRTCGYQLGREVKLLLDSNVCPFCESSEISLSHPRCGRCGYHADTGMVVWG